MGKEEREEGRLRSASQLGRMEERRDGGTHVRRSRENGKVENGALISRGKKK